MALMLICISSDREEIKSTLNWDPQTHQTKILRENDDLCHSSLYSCLLQLIVDYNQQFFQYFTQENIMLNIKYPCGLLWFDGLSWISST